MEPTEAELAFFQAMPDGTAPFSNGIEEQDAADEYDPTAPIGDPSFSNLQNISNSPSSSMSASMPQSPATPLNDEGAANTSESNKEAANAPSAPRQPRTIGGFVVDDDDDEEEENQTAIKPETNTEGSADMGSGTHASADAALRSITQTPINGLPIADVPVSKAQDQDLNGALSSGAADSVPVSSVSANASAPVPKTVTPVPPVTDAPTKPTPAAATIPANKARLPQDVVGRLEDRIAEDPRGDLDAWMTLIAEYRKRSKLDDARAVYEKFFEVFPTAVEQWLAYANMELEEEALNRLEMIFNKALPKTLSVQLWTMYLDYVRRRNNLMTDPEGKARQTVLATFKFVLDKIGIDKDSGAIWDDYLQFLKSGPGKPDGNTWQDGQKRDEMRSAFQRAVCIPTQAVTSIWKQYDTFELGINKVTGRKFLQEKSPAFVTARSSLIHLDNITRGLDRYATPRLPPMKGFGGDEEYMRQVEIWNNWIRWEKDDPLVLRDDDLAGYKARVLYVYKQALMPLRFWPEIWSEAAKWCYENDMNADGDNFLAEGMAANPESCLLAFRKGDRLELTVQTDDTDEGKIKKGNAVREPYDKVLDALYDLLKKTKKRQEQFVANVKEGLQAEPLDLPDADDDDEDEETRKEKAEKAREATIKSQLEFIARGGEVQLKSIKRTISHAWIALMRAMRRVQGKGTTGKQDAGSKPGGFRAIFQEARKKGNTTSEFWLALAALEYHYRDPAAPKVYERAAKLYPDDPLLQLTYIKWLIDTNDVTNARAAFASAVGKMTGTPEKVAGSKALYAYFHEYESQFGELAQIIELEKRMAEIFPEDPSLANFSRRFQNFDFDPTAVRHIISQSAQARPKALPVPPPAVAVTEAAPASIQNSPQPSVAQVAQVIQTTSSPKRPMPFDDSDLERPSKIQRGESPLKGAAGRRLAAAGRVQQASTPTSNLATPQVLPPAPLAKEINFLLSIIPGAHTYNVTKLDPQKMVNLLDNIDLTRAHAAQPPPAAVLPVPPQFAHLGQFPPTPQAGHPQMFPPPPGVPFHYTR